jgi:DNA transformation protein
VTSFVSYLAEVFVALGPIETKRMFGGHGVYHDGVMFALVADDELYLKVDAASLPDFERAGCRAFEYQKDGQRIAMSYWSAPAELFEDPAEAARWARRALEVARAGRGRRRRSGARR